MTYREANRESKDLFPFVKRPKEPTGLPMHFKTKFLAKGIHIDCFHCFVSLGASDSHTDCFHCFVLPGARGIWPDRKLCLFDSNCARGHGIR